MATERIRLFTLYLLAGYAVLFWALAIARYARSGLLVQNDPHIRAEFISGWIVYPVLGLVLGVVLNPWVNYHPVLLWIRLGLYAAICLVTLYGYSQSELPNQGATDWATVYVFAGLFLYSSAVEAILWLVGWFIR